MQHVRRPYSTDLSDAEWAHLEPYVPAPNSGGRPVVHPRREILNAIFYVIRSGGAWRLLPHDLPKWQTVYHYWRIWRRDGTWERIHTALRERLRVKLGRNSQPSASIIDSQSVKTTSVGGERGYDGAKKLNGRKRHLLVDTQGLVLKPRCIVPIFRIVLLSRWCWTQSATSSRVWLICGPIRGTTERERLGSRSNWAGRWRLSVIPRNRAVSGLQSTLSSTGTRSSPRAFAGFSRGGGWLNEPLAGYPKAAA